MKYNNIIEGKFISRPNRFAAYVCVDGMQVKAHVKNTGRLKELLVSGAAVYLQKHDDPKRNTALSLIAVKKGNKVVNIDSQAPNRAMYEWLAAYMAAENGFTACGQSAGTSKVYRVITDEPAFGRPITGNPADGRPMPGDPAFCRPASDGLATCTLTSCNPLVRKLTDGFPAAAGKSMARGHTASYPGAFAGNATPASILRTGEKITAIRPEYGYRDSRFDFLIETDKRKILMEVKGVTLEEKGTALFPDAPTERGVRHITELCGSMRDGYYPVIAFMIQMNGVRQFSPNAKTHKEFADALVSAHEQGVCIIALDCEVTRGSMVIRDFVDVVLQQT